MKLDGPQTFNFALKIAARSIENTIDPFEVHIRLVTQCVEVDVYLPRNQKLVLMIFRDGISVSILTKDVELDKNICKTQIKWHSHA